MTPASQNEAILRFGAFELNLRAGELYKSGRKIRLQVLPLRILAILLELPGQVVTREELRERLWSADTFVDFDHSLNTAIRKLRRALNDEAVKPRFIETLPRRGYRFVGSAPDNLHAPRSRKPFDSIAVLPFENVSADPETEYLSDGITESIIGSLSHLPKLRVVARSAVFRYKGQLPNPQKVGNELNVRTVLTGRVVQRGDSLTIGTELVDVANGWRLWGEQYGRKLADLLAVQEEIANEISERLRLKLTGDERKRLSKRPTGDAQAYQDYLRGRFYWNKRTADGVKKGIEYFEKAIEQDPNYPLAYVGLADSYNSLGFYAYAAPRDAYPKARAAALRALEIDDTLTEAQASLADVKLYYDWDWSGAATEFNRVVERNPAYATGHLIYGDLLVAMGRFKEGIAETEKAQELDPLSLIINAGVGWCFYFARQYDKAIEQLRKTLEMDQHFVPGHAWLGGTYLQQGLFPEGITELRAASEISGGSHLYVALLAHAYGVAGDKAQAQKILDQLKDQSARSYVSSYSIAEICLALGDRNQAIEWLEKAHEERARALVMLKVEPKLDPLRSDPLFQGLLRRMNFPPTPSNNFGGLR